MSRSIAAGHVVEIASEMTLADGLAGQIDDDALQIGQRCLDDIVALEEERIGEAIAWLHTHEALTVEGAGAVTVAALLDAAHAGRPPVGEAPIVAIVSGRNIDESRRSALLRRWADVTA
jgi:threonine dehydratase